MMSLSLPLTAAILLDRFGGGAHVMSSSRLPPQRSVSPNTAIGTLSLHLSLIDRAE